MNLAGRKLQIRMLEIRKKKKEKLIFIENQLLNMKLLSLRIFNKKREGLLKRFWNWFNLIYESINDCLHSG